MKKYITKCMDCLNYVPNGELCKCQVNKEKKQCHCVPIRDRLKKCFDCGWKRSPFSGAGQLFSSEIDPYEEIKKMI